MTLSLNQASAALFPMLHVYAVTSPTAKVTGHVETEGPLQSCIYAGKLLPEE